MGAGSSGLDGKDETVPMWIYTAQPSRDISSDKFSAISPGMHQIGPNTVARQRTGTNDSDAAQWKRGFNKGKHVFEIVFPMQQRGQEASVGVGFDDAPLHCKGTSRACIVGNNDKSWGISLRTRRALHKNNLARKYPQKECYLSDKFYMYLDCDAGLLQFGSDIEYYGTAHSGIPKNCPKLLYPMVGATHTGATVTMVYRGEGDPSRVINIATVPAGPPIQKPSPRKTPPSLPDSAPYPNGPRREGTDMSKMTDSGPPPPPPTKIGNPNIGSMLSLKEENMETLLQEAIPEEGRDGEAKLEEEEKGGVKREEGDGGEKTSEGEKPKEEAKKG